MMKIFTFLKKRHDWKITIIERERTTAVKERLVLLKQHERAMKNQAEALRIEFKKELDQKIDEKNQEIRNLKKLLSHLKESFENLHSLSGELAMEFRTVAILAGKSQNRFVNIQDRALREAEHIEGKIGKIIQRIE